MQQPTSQTPPPHGIMGLTEYRFPWEQWLGIGFFSLVLASLILYLLMKYQEKFASKETQQTQRPAEDPVSTIRKALSTISPQEPFSKDQQVSFFYELSLIFRKAVELKTGLAATDMTYAELEPVLQKNLPFESEQMNRVFAFLKQSDFIKFSDNVTTIPEAREALYQVRDWVEEILKKEPIH